MTADSQPTDRAFTVVVCANCPTDATVPVVDELRPTVRRCPHGLLISSGCLLGPLTCASRPTGNGVMAVVQPCTSDRAPSGPSHWVGPLTCHPEIAQLRQWLEIGRWETNELPAGLRAHHTWSSSAGRRN